MQIWRLRSRESFRSETVLPNTQCPSCSFRDWWGRLSLHGWAQNGISRIGSTTRTTELSALQLSSVKLVKYQNAMADFRSGDFAVWEAHALLKWCIEVILCIELKQSYFEILQSVPAVCAGTDCSSLEKKPSLSSCRALSGKQWKPTIYHYWSIYYGDMTCFDVCPFWWLHCFISYKSVKQPRSHHLIDLCRPYLRGQSRR